ncbi:MAG: HAMP domain-containing histidine kinase [Calditrichaeota bacterium]|nr:HAMP domain-containing histidine kinase [Calditrichota bacterium]
MLSSSKFRSLKFRLMVLISLTLLVVVGLPVGIFVYLLDKNYSEFATNMIETTSQVVYQFIYEGMMKNDSLVIQKNLELLALDPSLRNVRIYRPEGLIIYSSTPSEIKKDIGAVSDFFSPEDKGEVKELFFRNENIYIHHHPIRVEQECTTCHTNKGSLLAILDVRASFTPSEQIYGSVKNIAIFGSIIIIIFLWIFLNLIYHSQVENRLQMIMRGLERISSGKFNFKIKMPGWDELTLLAEKFNQMVENLKQSRLKEEQFIQEKLERADRLVTLGEVAAEIAHEVNNPAGIILSRAEILKEEIIEKGADSESLNDLNMIIQQTEKIAETTKSILHYSRKLPQQFSETDLGEIIKHSIKILEPIIKKHDVKIHLEIPGQACIIWGNYNQLEQVFCNLINNSLDFLPPGRGIIDIRISEKYDNKNKKIYLTEYEDNGPGISPEYRDKIFSPFFTTKEKDKGTGLGLFIVKNIIANHRGTIHLEEKDGSGARFVIGLESINGKS